MPSNNSNNERKCIDGIDVKVDNLIWLNDNFFFLGKKIFTLSFLYEKYRNIFRFRAVVDILLIT